MILAQAPVEPAMVPLWPRPKALRRSPGATDAGDGRATPVAKRVAAAKGLTLGQIAAAAPVAR